MTASFRTRRRIVLGILTLLLLGSTRGRADWPQWRGPGGQGVATEPTALPDTWGTNSANIRWRTEIPGEGISSPIVSNGRVFVTTAYEGAQSRLQHGLLAAVVGALALTYFLSLARGLRRGGSRDPGLQEGPRLSKLAAGLDAVITYGASSAFVLVAVLIAVRPDLFFTKGDPGPTWLIAGAVGLLGLAASFGWLNGNSRWRLLAVPTVLFVAFLLVYFKQAGVEGPTALWKRAAVVAPGIAVVAWYLLNYFRLREYGSYSKLDKARRPLVATLLLVLAALVFVPPNFLTGLQRVIVCLDPEGGNILWQSAVFSAPPEQKYPSSTYATPTPATDGERVFAYFGSGLASVDFDGRLLWTERFPRYSRYTRYGAAASPVLTENAVIVVQEKEESQGGPPSWIAAFDKDSGRRVWEINPPEAHDSYTTPLLFRRGSETLLLTASWKALVAYDPESGERLWTHEYPMQQMVASMAQSGDLVALTGGAHGDRTLMVLRIEAERADSEPELIWQSRKSVAAEASPIIYDSKLFAVSRSGIMTTYDLETGAVHWRERLNGHKYYSSLAAGDGKVYAPNVGGTTMVVKADSEFELIAANDLDAPIYASPAISDGCLLIRTEKSLFCIEKG